MQILGNGPRESISAARNGGSGSSISVQTVAIVWGLQQLGVSADPEVTLAIAAAVASTWAFVAGAVAKTARDELHLAEAGKVYHGPTKRTVLLILSAIG